MREYVEDLPVVTVLNAAWQQGMGSSLRAGMEALAGTEPLPEAVLLTVCDQPGLAAEHLRELLARHAAAQSACKCTITASSYAERYGVPAVFSATMFTELSAASGDRGARDLILAHRSQVQGIPWPAGVLDIDRPEDLGTIEP